jgi:hypothetical protein
VALIAVWLAATNGMPMLWAIPLLATGVALVVTATVAAHDRAVAAGIFAWALFLRLSTIFALMLADRAYAEGAFLSPDGHGYFDGSRRLAESGFALGPPVAVFGTYDVGHYYLFAGILAVFGPHLLALEVANACLGALGAIIAFGWARIVVPRFAVLLAAVIALSPTLVLLSTTNLLKDPSILLFTLVAVWCAAKLLTTSPSARWFAWIAGAVLALSYLHFARFYVAAYLEAGIAVAIAAKLVALFAFAQPRRHLVGLIALVAVVILGEVIPVAAGWPTAPAMVVAQAEYVGATPAMQRSSPAPTRGLPSGAPVVPGIPGATAAVSSRVAAKAIDVLRRAFGPFVWVPPDRLDLRYLLLADFSLYPDTLLWCLALPALVVGIGLALVAAWKDGGAQLTQGFVAVFLCIYLAQYLAINLSYRQREDVLPLILAIVPSGATWLAARHSGRVAYVVYVGGLVMLAVTQVTLHAVRG